MSLILCIETATEICSVVLSENGKTICLKEISEGNTHASQLHPLVEQALAEAGLHFNQLKAIAVSKGPGSYTGLRVGISAAKGYCYALGLPLIAIDTLTSLANNLLQKKSGLKDYLLVPMIDARRMEVYTAILDQHLHFVESISAKVITSLSFENQLANHALLFFGNGAAKCKEIINHSNAIFLEDDILCSAEGLSMPSYNLFLQNSFEDTAYFEPFYLKDFIGAKSKTN